MPDVPAYTAAKQVNADNRVALDGGIRRPRSGLFKLAALSFTASTDRSRLSTGLRKNLMAELERGDVDKPWHA